MEILVCVKRVPTVGGAITLTADRRAIDTKASGFVVSDVPLHTIITVTGTVVPGTEPGIAATGIRY